MDASNVADAAVRNAGDQVAVNQGEGQLAYGINREELKFLRGVPLSVIYPFIILKSDIYGALEYCENSGNFVDRVAVGDTLAVAVVNLHSLSGYSIFARIRSAAAIGH